MRHRVAHVLAFGGAALIWIALGTNGRGEFRGALIVLATGLLIETAQHLIYKGPIEWWDVRDDTIGILIAALIVRRTRVRRLLLAD